MNPYELCLLLRVMPKVSIYINRKLQIINGSNLQPEIITTLKRAADAIYDKGGIIRKLENMGTRPMPFKTSNHGMVYNKAAYFLLEFNIPPTAIEDLKEEYARDVDIIRRRIYKKVAPDNFECTLHEELKPPPYRKSVQELVANARKMDKPKYDYRSGLDYYPFQK